MTILYEERPSDSPYIEMIQHGWTASGGSTIRPSEVHWHLVFARHNGNTHAVFVGPLTSAGVVSYAEGAEILWIKFRLGTFMPHLPPSVSLDADTNLPEARRDSFWLKGSAWELPDYENAETFIDRLVREEILVHDRVVEAALHGRPQEVSPRTVRHRFQQATGLTQLHVYQAERARRAEALLKQGSPILEAVYELGYYDQPHMTRALKQYIGYTPGQIVQMSEA